MKILLFMCGEGLGHTSRCLALGKEFLAAGHEVHFGAYGYSKELIEKTGYQAHEIPPELTLVGERGGLSLKKSIGATLKNGQLFGGSKLRKLIKEIEPDVVLSDGYYLGILAAKAQKIRESRNTQNTRKIPVYAIAHQFNMVEFFEGKGPLTGALGKFIKKFYTYIFRRVDGIIVPDFPLPYSVNRRNFPLSREINKTIFFSGPIVRARYAGVEAKPLKSPAVLSTIGAFGYRAAIFKSVLEAAKLDPGINYTFILGPGVKQEDLPERPKNVEFVGFTDNPFPYFKGSDAVITAGGHSTLLESLSFGLPVLSFPDERHNEQENNATVLEENGYGRRMSYLARPEGILACVREVLEDESYRKKTERLRRLAEELDGPGAVRELLEAGLYPEKL